MTYTFEIVIKDLSFYSYFRKCLLTRAISSCSCLLKPLFPQFFPGSSIPPSDTTGLLWRLGSHHRSNPRGSLVLQNSHQTNRRISKRRSERWLIHVNRWTPRRLVKTCWHVRVWDSCEAFLYLTIFLYVKHARHFLQGHLPHLPARSF